MTTEFSGSGDPARTVELLWGLREPSRRGPKQRLTVPQIAEAAIALADGEGLAALSMRRVAERLGVTAMSLYTYVPSKAELVDVMLDTVLGELPTPEPPGPEVPAGWRARLERVARDKWALYLRHPWLLQVSTSRPPMGPNLMARYEYELGAVEGTGLPDVAMDLVVTLVGDYVHGAARAAVAAVQIQQRSGMSDAQWWEGYAPLLAQVLDPRKYPVSSRVGSAAGEEFDAPNDPERAFEFGLARVLDGVEALISRS